MLLDMFVSNRAGRRVTEQIGRFAWSALELAKELGCNGNTVNDAVVAYGETLVDIPGRFGAVEVLRLDEVIYARRGPFPPPGVLDLDHRYGHRPALGRRSWSQR